MYFICMVYRMFSGFYLKGKLDMYMVPRTFFVKIVNFFHLTLLVAAQYRPTVGAECFTYLRESIMCNKDRQIIWNFRFNMNLYSILRENWKN